MRVKRKSDVVSVFVIFSSQQCQACKEEVIFEKMYMKVTGPYFGGVGRAVHVCKKCCSSIVEAENAFKEIENERSRRPQPPPPPPSKRLSH